MLGLQRVVCLIILRFVMNLCLLGNLVMDVICCFLFSDEVMVFMFMVCQFVIMQSIVQNFIISIFMMGFYFF